MFIKAIPVWGNYKDNTDKLNRQLVFRETVENFSDIVLNIAASDFYRLTVGGKFVGFGPARTAKGYARVDSYDLTEFSGGEIIIEVAGYRCKSLSTCLQDSFFCAELTKKGEVLKYTGRDFECFENARRVRVVERYSAQRHFGEIYDGYDLIGGAVDTILVRPDVKFIPRRVPFASFKVTDVDRYISRGIFKETEDGRADSGEFGTGKKQFAYSVDIYKEPDYGYFPPEEIKDKPYRYVGGLEKTRTEGEGSFPVTLSEGEWLMVDLNMIVTGFIRLSATAHGECDIIIAFSEMCNRDTFYFRNINLHSVIEYKLPAGKINVESFEPYNLRHGAIFVKKGSITVESFGYRSFERDVSGAIHRQFKKAEHTEIYRAALRSFAHNAVDLFTDCPSRERAGWLCDSFFTGRAEHFFFGDSVIEDAFLENYVLYKNEGEFPEGVLPMCYPSDPHENFKFIPQWDMWYVLEVCEYLKTRRPDADREIFRPTVMGVLGFLKKYENGDGLLEDLPSWNFVEWSDANTWTKNVNYPTNFLYAALLSAVAKVFDRPELEIKAEALRIKTRELSFGGEFFVDHAKRLESGELINENHVSEACQYYAILYGGADLDLPEYAELKKHVVSDFKDFAPIGYKFCPKNAFIGLYLRMNVLMNMNDRKLLSENLSSLFLKMSRETSTLWEYRDGYGSLDHGFASYVALTIPFADEEDTL